jgi:Arc/MetJ-type ribon-helix-helix transcriptional regulator
MYSLSMTAKSRLSVTVDSDLIAVVHAAVAAGTADSMSAWVSDALRLKLDHDRRLRSLGDFIAAYEAEHGQITEEEMEAAERSMRERAIVVRGGKVVRNGMTDTSRTGTE